MYIHIYMYIYIHLYMHALAFANTPLLVHTYYTFTQAALVPQRWHMAT